MTKICTFGKTAENDGPRTAGATKSEQFLAPLPCSATSFAAVVQQQQFPQILIHRSSTTTEDGDGEQNSEKDDEKEEEGIWHNRKNAEDVEISDEDNNYWQNAAGVLANSSSSSSVDLEEQRLDTRQIRQTAQEGIDDDEQRKVRTMMSGRIRTIQTMMTMINNREDAFCNNGTGNESGTVVSKWPTMYRNNGGTVIGDKQQKQQKKGMGGEQLEEDGTAKGKRPFSSAEWRRSPICHQLARFYHKFGIRHFVLVGVLAFYAIFGGLLFQAIEKDNEYISLKKNKETLEEMIEQLANKLTTFLAVQPSDEQLDAMQQMITEYYQTMLKIEGKYIGSVFHKYEHIVVNLSWYFVSSVFYAMTLFTTIGYGTMACQTTLGRLLSIIYALFGIPLMLVVLSDIGQLLLRFLASSYKRFHAICSFWLRSMAFRILDIDEEAAQFASREKLEQQQQQSDNCAGGEGSEWHNGGCWTTRESAQMPMARDFEFVTDDSVVLINNTDHPDPLDDHSVSSSSADQSDGLPLFVSVPLVLLYLCFIAFVVSFFDWPDKSVANKGPSLSFFEAFYFAFISLSTIGLGDVMPNSIEFSPFLSLLFLGGLALLSVVNLTIYQHIQKLFFCLFDRLEAFFDDVYSAQNDQNIGHFVFTSLMPNIQLLAFALPIFSDDRKGKAHSETSTISASAELLHVRRRMFSVSRTPSLIHLSNYFPRKGYRGRAFSIAKSEGQPYHQHFSSSAAAHHRSTYHTVHGNGTDFRPTLGILSTAPSSPARSRGPSIRSRRTSAHKIPGSPASIRPKRQRAVTIGCAFDYAENGGAVAAEAVGISNAAVGNRQKLCRHKSIATLWRRTAAKSAEAIVPRNSAAKTATENEAKSGTNDGIQIRLPPAEEIGTAGEGHDETKASPTERRIYFKEDIAGSATASSSSSAVTRQIRRTHSERVSHRRHHSHGGALLYVIDETEPHQQTIAGGERLLRVRRLRRQRSRQNVPQQQQLQDQNDGMALTSTQVENNNDNDDKQKQGGGGGGPTSPSSSRRVQIRVEPLESTANGK